MNTLAKKLYILAFFLAFGLGAIFFTIPVHAYDGAYEYDSYSDYGSGYNDQYYSDPYSDPYSGTYSDPYYDSGSGTYDYGTGYNDQYYSDPYYDSGYGAYNSDYYNSSYGGCSTCNNTVVYNTSHNDTCSSCHSTPLPQPVPQPVPQTPELVVSCVADRYDVNSDETVTWTANVSGGTGSYNYSWTGTEGLSGSNRIQNKTYTNSGNKTASVTVTSGSKTKTADCGSVYVNENNNNFDISCSVDNTYVNVGDQVHMTAYASNGNGNYSYTWYGDYPLDGRTGSSQYVSYNSTGDKDVRVTVRSYNGGQEKTRNCGTVHVGNNYNSGYNNYYYNNNDLNISCTVNTANATVGQLVTWNTSVTGGNGNYYYAWNGTDGLYGNSSSMSKNYGSVGTKSASVTVTSNGQTKYLNCPNVVVGAVTYVPPAANLASLSSVYLNQVPYTGVGDSPKFMAFMIGLILWSAAMAYVIIFRKRSITRKNHILDFKKENMAKRGLI